MNRAKRTRTTTPTAYFCRPRSPAGLPSAFAPVRRSADSSVHRREDGLLVLTLRKKYANGTTDFIFSEVELAQRLAALVPPKGKNGISYHGVFGASR